MCCLTTVITLLVCRRKQSTYFKRTGSFLSRRGFMRSTNCSAIYKQIEHPTIKGPIFLGYLPFQSKDVLFYYINYFLSLWKEAVNLFQKNRVPLKSKSFHEIHKLFCDPWMNSAQKELWRTAESNKNCWSNFLRSEQLSSELVGPGYFNHLSRDKN